MSAIAPRPNREKRGQNAPNRTLVQICVFSAIAFESKGEAKLGGDGSRHHAPSLSAAKPVNNAFSWRWPVLRQKVLLAAPLFFALVACSHPRVQNPSTILAEADRLALLFNFPKAAPLYAQAQSLFEHSGDKKNALIARLGYIWATADTGASPALSQEVAFYLQDPLVKADPALMVRTFVTKAALDRDGSESAARGAWEQVLRLARTLGDKSWEERAQAEIAGITYMDGDVKSAASMIREALISQYLRRDLGAAINYTGMVGGGFVESGQPETALQYCNVALRLAAVVKDIGFPFLAYQGKARALVALHRKAEAEDVLKEALARARDEQNYVAATQLMVVAGNASASDNPAKAIQYLKEAADLSEAKGLHHAFAWSTFELAKVLRDAGNLDSAEAAELKAIAAMREVEDRYHLPDHLTLLADVEAKKGNYEQAERLYSEAADVIDSLLVNVTTRQLESTLIATESEAYLGHFELLATKFSDTGKAFQVIEKARGRSLADALRGESETMSATDDVTREAQKEISQIQLALLHEMSRDRRQTLLDKLFEEEQRLSPVRRSSSALRPTASRPEPVALHGLQASLHSDEMLLEYVLDEPHSYCLHVTRTSAAISVLPVGRKQIEDLVENYLSAVRSRRSEAKIAEELYSVLLQSTVGQHLKARLLIIPDGNLHLLPFDALRDQHGRYVLESNVVTYAPSGTVLYLIRKSHPSHLPTVDFLGVGGVVYSSPVPTVTKVINRTIPNDDTPADFFGLNGVRLPDLPGSRQEVMSITAIVKGKDQLLLGENATEAAFKSLPLADFRIIHLAVHGVASTRFPNRAALVFGSAPASSEDGLLQVREIQDLPFDADLVTLSACDTGQGQLLGEEGIASLERAFLMAGAKAVIASRWTADDIYTMALMKRLYQHLVDGENKGAALRQAKLDLLKEFGEQALPDYWAGFELVGDGSTAITDK